MPFFDIGKRKWGNKAKNVARSGFADVKKAV